MKYILKFNPFRPFTKSLLAYSIYKFFEYYMDNVKLNQYLIIKITIYFDNNNHLTITNSLKINSCDTWIDYYWKVINDKKFIHLNYFKNNKKIKIIIFNYSIHNL